MFNIFSEKTKILGTKLQDTGLSNNEYYIETCD
jgi:hypothetical protein